MTAPGALGKSPWLPQQEVKGAGRQRRCADLGAWERAAQAGAASGIKLGWHLQVGTAQPGVARSLREPRPWATDTPPHLSQLHALFAKTEDPFLWHALMKYSDLLETPDR